MSKLPTQSQLGHLNESSDLIRPKVKRKRPLGGVRSLAGDDSVLHAAKTMIQLNRYCLHPSCSGTTRTEILHLQKGLVERLYSSGYCTGVKLDERTMPGKVCQICEGGGYSCYHNGRICPECGGTGISRPEMTLRSYVTRFEIKGEPFTWRQRYEDVHFEINNGEPSEFDEPAIMPLELSRRRLAEAKAAVRRFVSEPVNIVQ